MRKLSHPDVFISHASEDKGAVARPLAEHLRDLGVSVWFDEFELKIGDPLREKIDDGLRHSRVGVVILSQSFFSKNWPKRELDGLTVRQIAGERNVILPVWHDVGPSDVESYSLPLANLVAAKSSDGVEAVAQQIVDVLDGLAGDAPERALAGVPRVAHKQEVPRQVLRIDHPRSASPLTDIERVVFSTDGRRIATASHDHTARVWGVDNGRELTCITHRLWVKGVAFSPDGQRIATASADDTARVLKIDTKREYACVNHDRGVNDVAFSPDGGRIATASDDTTARIWDTDNGREVMRLTHFDVVYGVAFHPNGDQIVTASWDQTARYGTVAAEVR
jgi:Tol biopolymer transport system component